MAKREADSSLGGDTSGGLDDGVGGGFGVGKK